jgi:hypothetical protein
VYSKPSSYAGWRGDTFFEGGALGDELHIEGLTGIGDAEPEVKVNKQLNHKCTVIIFIYEQTV